MSDSQSDLEENNSLTEINQQEQVPSEDEDDYENYFLQPTGENVNIAEKIAEANKKLFEENAEEEDDLNRSKKVQFSENLVDFEPAYHLDEEFNESAQNSTLFEKNSNLTLIPEEFCNELDEEKDKLLPNFESNSKESINEEIDEIIEEIVGEDFDDPLKKPDEIFEESNDEGGNKLLLVLLPREQNSSCESIICEDESEETTSKVENKKEFEKIIKPKIVRPKSASGLKHKKICEVSKISPVLEHSSNMERKSWQITQNLHSKHINKVSMNEKKKKDESKNICDKMDKSIKKINIGNEDANNFRKYEEVKKCYENRPKSSYYWKNNANNVTRPYTAPIQRTCCVLKSELPQYNGLRSEYGLSAQQLQERKQRTMQLKHQRKQNQLKERQEELRKMQLNEESFQKWLFSKNKKCHVKSPVKTTDTLTRSDAFIQAHASYAMNRNVPYSIDYSLTKKSSRNKELTGKKSTKTIIVEKFLKKVPPLAKKTFNIYL